VLVLSTKLDIGTIRQATIKQLKVVSPRLDYIRQIVAARRYKCAVLLDKPSLAHVQQLTLKEMQDLPVEDLHTSTTSRES